MARQNPYWTGTDDDHHVADEEAEVYGYAQDREHAAVWAVWDDGEVYGVHVYHCEDEAADEVDWLAFDKEDYESSEDLATQLAESDPAGNVIAARESWGVWE